MNAIEPGSQTNYPCAGEPTLASAWRAAACVAITDELLAWPADVFALTDVALARSGAYRFAVSWQGRTRWPEDRHDWPRAVEEAGRQWGTLGGRSAPGDALPALRKVGCVPSGGRY